jgi:hypothetical protein
LLEVYNIQGGRKLKYRNMKEKLLDWYKKQRIGGRSYWKNKLVEARPGDSETLDIYTRHSFGIEIECLKTSPWVNPSTCVQRDHWGHFLSAFRRLSAHIILHT